MKQPSLFDGPDAVASPPSADPPPPDQAARDFAVDPGHHVVLEASAGTGKTRVLVDRYVRLIVNEIDPRHILAVTFTRKAAAEMRERVLTELRRLAATGAIAPERWRALAERMPDIQISTIDAFCFALLREFPLEAGVDPAFEVVDETEMARFTNEAIDLTCRTAAGLMDDESVRLLFARVKLPVLRETMASLVDRRHVALPAIRDFLEAGRPIRTAADIATPFIDRLHAALQGAPYRAAWLDDGPKGMPEFDRLAADLESLDRPEAREPSRVRQLRRRLERYCLTSNLEARKRLGKVYTGDRFRSKDARRRHEDALGQFSVVVVDEIARLDADINRLLARGLYRLLVIAVSQYERLLDEHALLDFASMLDRAVTLMAAQEEFARSRLKLQARYHHVLVDEVQDTSRRQWQLISLLVDAWGEGEGAADASTSIFVVGDRKQSIYRFRHAEVTLFDEIARRIGALGMGRPVRQAITTSFRAVPELLAFVNALGSGIESAEDLPERFAYGETDRFPIGAIAPGARRDGEPVLGVMAEPSVDRLASAVADEIRRLLEAGTVVRDRASGPRPVRPDDIAILFRARAGHQYYEAALEARGVRTYVYKGLGFFDAPEVQDLQALIRYLAEPESDLRAAELLRSRFVRISDPGLLRLAPGFARALGEAPFDAAAAGLTGIDRALLDRARADAATWRTLAGRLRPSELLDRVIGDTAYAFEMRGRRFAQARENVKKVRALVRRIENRGYVTLGRLASYFETLRAGDESNAIVLASGAVNLMTMHAAKGLEFPVVFLVNLHMAGRGRPAISVIERGAGGEPEVAFSSTAGTALEERRETEELRRLFYVATTRARDRLYLAAEVNDDGTISRGSRSLASLMPPALAAIFPRAAAAAGGDVEWTTNAGAFAFRVCRPSAEAAAVPDAPAASDTVAAPSLLVAGGSAIVSAVELGVSASEGTPSPRPTDAAAARVTSARSHDRLVGVVVHRMFQRVVPLERGDRELAETAAGLVRADERTEVEDLVAFAAAAASLYRRFRGRPDVAALLASGVCYYEVPFSYRPQHTPGAVVRGAIDCLVVEPGGDRAAILEFKTGARRPEHAVQAAIYADAARAALGLPDVAVHILYP